MKTPFYQLVEHVKRTCAGFIQTVFSTYKRYQGLSRQSLHPGRAKLFTVNLFGFALECQMGNWY
jgi:hypothetical protein